MKAVLKKASDRTFNKTIEVGTIDDLLNIMKATGNRLVLNNGDILDRLFGKSGVLNITIYDDYME